MGARRGAESASLGPPPTAAAAMGRQRRWRSRPRRLRAPLPLLLALLQLAALLAGAAAAAAPAPVITAADAPPAPTCGAVAAELWRRHRLALPLGLQPDGGGHLCRGTLAARARPPGAAGAWLDWNVTVALHLGLAAERGSEAWEAARQCATAPHREQQQQEQQGQGQEGQQQPEQGLPPSPAAQRRQQQWHPQWQPQAPRPSVAALAADNPSAGGIYLNNLLCMPRLTLLWHWLTGEWRSALAAASGGGSSGGGGDAVGGGGGADGPHEGWEAVQSELSMLQTLQRLASSPPAGPASAAPRNASSGGVARIVSPPFGGGQWEWARFWAFLVAAPGVLVALQVAEACPHEPWFVVHVAWLGFLRAFAEAHALYVALFTDLSSAEQLDRLVLSHVVPAVIHLVLAALQAMFAPLMPHALLVGLFWLRCVVVPALDLYAIHTSWLPDWAGGSERGSMDRRRRRHRHHQNLRPHQAQALQAALATGGGAPQQARPAGGGGSDGGGAAAPALQPAGAAASGGGALAASGGGGAGGGGGGAAPLAAAGAGPAAAAVSSSRPVHWPPPLPIPRELDDAPDAPEAFRCPITLALMREPTQATSGITYERTAIMQWLEGSRFDPVTHAPLRRRHLSPNLTLRVLMEPWLRDQTDELRARGAGGGAEPAAAATTDAATAGAASASAAAGARDSSDDEPPARAGAAACAAEQQEEARPEQAAAAAGGGERGPAAGPPGVPAPSAPLFPRAPRAHRSSAGSSSSAGAPGEADAPGHPAAGGAGPAAAAQREGGCLGSGPVPL
ncbi:hypothetical protein Rsub_11777 [Raphidocelis subcapitata]|uniref:U-box domain-containing protein n=1 Tax=Raphidocelis subcapitata TaxID=307507 RepID=A0A2V0PJR2_9CHLO|nr:hypothetical protein Rsub_11777 [Raphidocelis subcapitata]|eukprot:GBF99252.1 hypothetical protein Rsub_11777 [Raphidocelis subcapitata]